MLTLKENKEEKEEGPWEEPLTVSGEKVPNQALTLPGYLKDLPFLLQVGQVWDAFDGRNSKEKKGFL
eukprot:7238133-Prorocentrum_lima.AAC.1